MKTTRQRQHQHNPNQAEMNICETLRKFLMANIDPSLSSEARIEARIKIRAMGYNELRASVIALNK